MLLHDLEQLRAFNVPERSSATSLGQKTEVCEQLAKANVGRQLDDFGKFLKQNLRVGIIHGSHNTSSALLK